MSSRLRDLIRAVRACKTAAEERSVIAKESAALRQAFRDQDTLYRHRNVAKLMFIHMLGYPTHFGQMETLKLIAATGFPEKRIGYLGLMILLDERHEVLMLVTNSLKNDLNSKNQFSVGLALTALGNICSVEMARDLSPELEKLLSVSNSYIRKKAALCCTRVLRKVPEAMEGFQERAHGLLKDRHHSVMLTGVTLMLEMCSIQPALIPFFREEVPLLVKILRTLLTSPFVPEYDAGGVTNPFLQVKVLQLLRILGSDNTDASDLMSDVLAQMATNTESSRNSGNAILYETVQTIMATENTAGLRVLGINILGRFLAHKDNNIRYVALNTLAKVVNIDVHAVQRHRQTILTCVKDTDVSIRRRALDLVYALINKSNIEPLTAELLDYLSIADIDFKADLVAKICQLSQQYAPNKRWHFDTILKALIRAGDHAKEEVCRTVVVLISNDTELQAYAARQSFKALQENQPNNSLLLTTLASWFLGEYGDQIVAGKGLLLDGEERISTSGQDIVTLLAKALTQQSQSPISVEYILTALMKLATRVPSQSSNIQGLIARQTSNPHLEIQSRSCEYQALFRFSTIRDQLMEAMPALDEKTYNARFSAPAIVATGPSLQGASKEANGALAADLGDLLALDDDAAPATASNPATANNYLQDLLADGPSASQQPMPAASTTADLLDLLGAPTPATTSPQAVTSTGDPFAGLGTNSSALAEPHSQSWPRTRVYDNDGIHIDFEFSKNTAQPNLTEITAHCFSTRQDSVTNFGLQAAVPKFMQLKLESASSDSLQGNGSAVTQKLRVSNSQHGIKSLALRLRISYTEHGKARTDMKEIRNLPPGL